MWNSTHDYEACVHVNGKPVTEVHHNGRTYIEGRPGSEYSLNFRNSTRYRVLVVPSVDGLSVLDGNPCGTESSGFVVEAYSAVDIPGWVYDSGTAGAFQFGKQGNRRSKSKTYVEQSGQDEANQGVLGFMVFQEKIMRSPRPNHGILRSQSYGAPVGQSMPFQPSHWDNQLIGSSVNMSQVKGMTGGIASTTTTAGVDVTYTTSNTSGDYICDSMQIPQPEESLGTKFGEAIEFNTVETQFRRASRNPKVTFVLYYDSIKNLEYIGVPVEDFRPKKYASAANPFPASPHLSKGCNPPQGWEQRNRIRRKG